MFMSTSQVALSADLYEPLAAPQDYEGPLVEMPYGGITGYIEGSYTKGMDDDVDTDAWALRGAINIDAGSGMNLQMDLGYADVSFVNTDIDKYDGGLHGYYRDELFAAGAFFAASRYDIRGSNDIKDYLGGIEGAFFQDTWTLVGAAGYGQTEWGGFDADHYMGALGARWYATDNVRFDVDGTFDRLAKNGGDEEFDIRGLKLTANYRPEQIPVTLFAGYKYTDVELPSSFSGDTNTIFGGLRFSYGSDSLKEEERRGPIWSNRSVSF
ncbi:hypothetical protein A8M32_10915 [Sinorhizobium alkalisoli]|uniref:Outer membrane protein n=2 Tax=Sinorhizobium alkalisoli TaxID=1752398 RepID=A0A1E3VDU7_9HYPH|nr:hypothetical protein A8M32_10915 [Sinorhizobium alkalisoli]